MDPVETVSNLLQEIALVDQHGHCNGCPHQLNLCGTTDTETCCMIARLHKASRSLMEHCKALVVSKNALQENCQQNFHDAIHWQKQFKRLLQDEQDTQHLVKLRDERERQLHFQITTLKNQLKKERDEANRIKNAFLQRETNLKHEKLRLEKELCALKATLEQALLANSASRVAVSRQSSLRLPSPRNTGSTPTAARSRPSPAAALPALIPATIEILNDIPLPLVRPTPLPSNTSTNDDSTPLSLAQERVNSLVMENLNLRETLLKFLKQLRNCVGVLPSEGSSQQGISLENLLKLPLAMLAKTVDREAAREFDALRRQLASCHIPDNGCDDDTSSLSSSTALTEILLQPTVAIPSPTSGMAVAGGLYSTPKKHFQENQILPLSSRPSSVEKENLAESTDEKCASISASRGHADGESSVEI